MSLADAIAIRIADELQKSPELRAWEKRRDEVYFRAYEAAQPWYALFLKQSLASFQWHAAAGAAVVEWIRKNPPPSRIPGSVVE